MTVSADQRPDRLGCYRLGEQLGAGGMGVVYLAAAPDERLVAVKVLRQEVMTDETAKRRLAREVETMRRVRSRYVAEVVDADVDGDPPYIVTRYVPGRTLEDTVNASGALSGDSLVSLARGLASALTAVHAAGVVHRDMKPAQRDAGRRRAGGHRLRHRAGTRLDQAHHDRHVHGHAWLSRS